MKKWMLFFILFLFKIPICKAQNLRFKHYGVPEGLPQETISCIAKDSLGFYWLGSSDGLARFDGTNFTMPQKDETSNLDLLGYKINCLFMEKEIIYIGTNSNGLLSLNISNSAIKQIGDNNANCTQIIKVNNTIYVSYYNKGIYQYDGKNKISKINFKQNFKPNTITSLVEYNNRLVFGDKDGRIFEFIIPNKTNIDVPLKLISSKLPEINRLKKINDSLFICTTNGLYLFNSLKNRHIISLINKTKIKQNYNITDIEKFKEKYYIATTKGLIIATSSFNVLKQFKSSTKYDKNTINSNEINDLFISNNLLLIGNINLDITSLVKQDVFSNPIKNYRLKDPSVFAVLNTKNYLFVGTSSGFIIRDNLTKKNKLLPNYLIKGFAKDGSNNLWLVTYNGAFVLPLNNLDFNNLKIVTIPIDKTKDNYLGNKKIRSVYKDKNNTIWITTFNNGIYKFTGNIANNDFTFKQIVSNKNMDKLPSSFAFSLIQGKKNEYWISTQKGLSKMTIKNNKIKFKNYNEKNGLINKGVLSSFFDKDNTLWVASRKGLNKYNAKKDQFKSYGKRDGLSNTFIYNILDDDANNLWLSTNGGLFRFNKKTEHFSNYTPKDGLQSTEFNLNAFYKNKTNGNLYFGGINGLNVFDPNKIDELDKESKLVFTELIVKDKIINPQNSAILSHDIAKAQKIQLKHNDFPVSLSFSALDFRPNANIQYAYKLLPGDKQWNNLNDKNNILLLSLPPKNHTLIIQGMSRGKLWKNLPLKLQISVNPPWYLSTLAYFLYVLFFLGVVYFLYTNSLQRKLASQETKRLQEIDALKSKFITNITHEFRTPLTIILGFLDNLKEQFYDKKETITTLNTIEQNSNNLLSLVNQMLDLNKLEKGNLTLNLLQNDIVLDLEQLVNSFTNIANNKHIKIIFKPDSNSVLMDFDAEKIRQIFTNLITVVR